MSHFSIKGIISLLSILFYSSIIFAQDTVSYNGTSGIRFKDIAYKTGADLTNYERQQCKLDVYIPLGDKKNFPVLIFFHGGGLVSGDKEEGFTGWSNNFGYEFLKKGVAIVSVNYRLSGESAKWPSYLNDAAHAVKWVTANVSSYGGNPKSIFVSGYSAGAYLTHMLSVDPQWYKEIGFNDNKICGYIPMSGQTREHANLAADLGIKKSELTTNFRHVMPLGNIKKVKAPVFIFVGGDEGQTVVDNELYYTLMKKKGNNVSFFVEPGKDHIKMRDSLGNKISTTREKILEFIDKYSRN
jgi:acetyl esterase/lipase